MELALLIYLAGIVGKLSAFLSIAGGLLYFIVLFIFIHTEEFKKALLPPVVVGFLLIFSSVLIPSEKTIYLMAGGYATQEIVTSDTAKKVLEILNEKLDTELEGLKSKKK